MTSDQWEVVVKKILDGESVRNVLARALRGAFLGPDLSESGRVNRLERLVTLFGEAVGKGISDRPKPLNPLADYVGKEVTDVGNSNTIYTLANRPARPGLILAVDEACMVFVRYADGSHGRISLTDIVLPPPSSEVADVG